MYVQLTMAERLKDLRVIDKKLTLEQLAEQTGLSKSALGKYENEDCGDINHYAIQKLAKFYGVSTDYLLGLTEQKNHSDVDVASLHLSDEVLELLRSGKINNRLLCEMMTHPRFRQLMADIEIVVDRIADMRIQDMNTVLEVARQKVMKEYAPDEMDVYMRTLATVYKGNIIKNLIMDCQSYTKYRPNETTGGIFVSWRRKEELPTGA